eukprot:552263-Karenia_brevis.AAC.1
MMVIMVVVVVVVVMLMIVMMLANTKSKFMHMTFTDIWTSVHICNFIEEIKLAERKSVMQAKVNI